MIDLPIREMHYFLSFSPHLEKGIFCIAGLVAIVLLIYSLRTLKRNIFFGLSLVLVLLYAVLPTTVSIKYVYFSCRVLIFVIFVGLLSLEVPKTVVGRLAVLVAAVGFSLAHIGITLASYRSVDRQVQDYYAAIENIPAGERVLFETDRQLLHIGRISPFAFLGDYYYIDRGGRIPLVASAQTSTQADDIFRSVRYRQTAVTRADMAAKFERLLALGRSHTCDINGYAIALSTGKDGEATLLSEKCGYKRLWSMGRLAVYRREFYPAAADKSPADSGYYTYGFNQGYDYVLLYQDESRIDRTMTKDFELIFCQGYAHVFKRRALIGHVAS
jgi:hypothetical protein